MKTIEEYAETGQKHEVLLGRKRGEFIPRRDRDGWVRPTRASRRAVVEPWDSSSNIWRLSGCAGRVKEKSTRPENHLKTMGGQAGQVAGREKGTSTCHLFVCLRKDQPE